MEQYISMGLNIVLLVFVAFGFLVGIIRGLKKTAFRGLFLIITVIIALFITMPITELLLGIKVQSTITIGNNAPIEGMYTIKENISYLIEEFLGREFVSQNPQSVELILSLPIMIINTIVYVLVFIILKYLLLPINFIIYKLSFGRRHKIESHSFSGFNENDFNDLKSIFNIPTSSEEQPNEPTNNISDNPVNNTPYIQSNNTMDNQSNNTWNNQTSEQPVDQSVFMPTSSDNSDVQNTNVNPLQPTSQPLGSIFDGFDQNQIINHNHTNNESSSAENTEQPIDNSTFQPVDNSKFEPSSNTGVFVSKDSTLEGEKNQIVFDVKMSGQTEIVDQPLLKNKKKKKDRPKKYRLLGGVLGMLIGVFVMSNILLPLYGTMDILKELNKAKLTNISETEISLNAMTDSITTNILNGYNSSIFKFASTYTAFEGISLAEFDYLTTQKIGNHSISLRQDVKAIVETTQKIDSLIGKYKDFTGEGNLSNLTKDQMSILLNNTKDLIKNIKAIEFVSTATDFIIPITCSILLSENNMLGNNENLNTMIKDCIRTIQQESNINLFDELSAMIDLAEYLNSKDVLTKIIKSDYSDPFIIIDSFDNEFVNKIFALKTVKVAIPHILNIGLTMIDESIQFGYVKNTADAETIKSAMSDFINKTLELAKTIDTESDMLITNESLIPLGKVLDSIKTSQIVNDQTYTNLITFAADQLQDIFTEIVPEDFRDYLQNEIINNIIKVDKWEYEMTIINESILKLRNVENGILGEVVEGKPLRQGLSIHLTLKDSVLEHLGETLDMLEETTIFGARTYRGTKQISGIASLMLNILDYTNETLFEDSDESTSKFSDFINHIKNNIVNSEHTYSKDNPTFWKNELKNISPLIINVYDMLDRSNFELNSNLGADLDLAKGTTMLGNGATLTLIKTAIDIVKDETLDKNFEYNNGSNPSNPQDINDKIYELFNDINSNLDTNSVKNAVKNNPTFWTNEIEYYIALTNIAEESTDISEIQDAVDLAEDLDKVYTSYTIPREGINKIIAFALKDTKTTITNPDTQKVELAINDTIDDICDKLNNQNFFDGKEPTNFWTIEFNHIKSITDIEFNTSNIKNELTLIGEKLDNICVGYEDKSGNTVRASYLIEHNNIRGILGSAIDEMSDNLTTDFDGEIKGYVTTALTSIKANIHDIINIPNISFKFELSKLADLSNTEISTDLVNYPTGSETEIQNKLNQNKEQLEKLGQDLDSIAYNYKFTTKYEYNQDANSKIITRPIINTLIKDIFNLGKIKDEAFIDMEESEKVKKEAFNDLITSIQQEIQKCSDDDLIISWKRELGYIDKLVTLNKDTIYSIDNAVDEIGKNVDAIAFNFIETSGVCKYNDLYQNGGCTIFIESINGNSLFITRETLLNTLAVFIGEMKTDTSNISDTKEKEEKEIINAIIDNIPKSVATTNPELNSGELHANLQGVFDALSAIEDAIIALVDSVTGSDIETIINYGQSAIEFGKSLDELLGNLEILRPCDTPITRRITILILDHIAIPTDPIDLSTSPAGKYHAEIKQKLIDHNDINHDNYNVKEEYSNKKYFETLFGKSIIPETI